MASFGGHCVPLRSSSTSTIATRASVRTALFTLVFTVSVVSSKNKRPKKPNATTSSEPYQRSKRRRSERGSGRLGNTSVLFSIIAFMLLVAVLDSICLFHMYWEYSTNFRVVLLSFTRKRGHSLLSSRSIGAEDKGKL